MRAAALGGEPVEAVADVLDELVALVGPGLAGPGARTVATGARGGHRRALAGVVLAVAPHHLASLVPELAPRVAHFEWEPIVTSYFTYPDWVRLPQPMLGVDAGLAQWLFDRGQLCEQDGLIAAVISARGRHLELPTAELERRIHAEIAAVVSELPDPLMVQTITEKRATFACVPGLQRPPARTPLPGLWLAGDYVAGDYPATLEGAVRSGVAAARGVLDA